MHLKLNFFLRTSPKDADGHNKLPTRQVAMTREKFPEKIPFRLTRMLTNAMEVRLSLSPSDRGVNAFDVCFGLAALKKKNTFTPESSAH